MVRRRRSLGQLTDPDPTLTRLELGLEAQLARLRAPRHYDLLVAHHLLLVGESRRALIRHTDHIRRHARTACGLARILCGLLEN